MKGDKQLPNWSSRPGHPEPPAQQPNAAAVAWAKFFNKVVEYAFGALVFAGMTACVGFLFMVGTEQMHQEFWPVPAFSFWFSWSFVWTTSTLAIWYYTIMTKGDK